MRNSRARQWAASQAENAPLDPLGYAWQCRALAHFWREEERFPEYGSFSRVGLASDATHQPPLRASRS